METRAEEKTPDDTASLASAEASKDLSFRERRDAFQEKFDDRFRVRFERTRRQFKQAAPQRPGQHFAEHERREMRIDAPNRAAIDRVLQDRRHEVEMAG